MGDVENSSANKFDIDTDTFISKLREIGLFIQDREHGTAYPNKQWLSWGYSEADMNNMNFMDMIHPDDRNRVKRAIENLESGNDENNDVLIRVKTADGSWRWVYSISITVARECNGQIKYYIGFDFDLTEQMNAKQTAERRAKESATLASAAAIINSQLNLSDTIAAILEQAKNVMPFTNATVQLVDQDHLRIAGGLGKDWLSENIGKLFPLAESNPAVRTMTEGEPLWLNPAANPDGQQIHWMESPRFAWLGVPLISRGEAIGVLTFERSDGPEFSTDEVRLSQNFGEHVAIALHKSKLLEETQRLSIQDQLTGAYNRRWMFEMLERETELCHRHNRTLSILLIDIDDFKNMNDSRGHLYGDSVLGSVASIVTGILRNGDLLCRYGGDEFLIILPHTNEANAGILAERIRHAVYDNEELKSENNPVTLSIGYSEIDPSTVNAVTTIIDAADNALFSAKRSGKNKSIAFSTVTSLCRKQVNGKFDV